LRSPLLVLVVGVLLPLGLACSGLPTSSDGTVTDGAATDGAATDGAATDGAAPEPEPAPEPVPANPDTLFPSMDPDEPPPFEKPSLKCPAGAMVIRNPSGSRLKIYCANGNGVRTGPYTEWQGKALRAAGNNVEGKLEGSFTKWAGTGAQTRKVEEQHYAAGVASGDFASWDEQGHLLARGRMHEGKRHGRFVENKVSGEDVVFTGVCYAAGEEQWRTEDPAEFTTKDCVEVDTDET
jgi:hypothetical protein